MPEQEIIARLSAKKLTLATAESLTGGLIASLLVAVPGASACFRGGAAVYQDDVKRDVLGVPQALLKKYSAVSAPVARAMAQGARRLFRADYALSATGYAGPGGDDVGLIYIAAASPAEVKVYRLRLMGGRQALRLGAARFALGALERMIDHGEGKGIQGK